MAQWEPITEYIYTYGEPQFRDFIKCFGFDTYAWYPQVNYFDRFLEGKRSYNAYREDVYPNGDRPPRMDHAAAFKRKGTRRIFYVYHPLCDLRPGTQLLLSRQHSHDYVNVERHVHRLFVHPGVYAKI